MFFTDGASQLKPFHGTTILRAVRAMKRELDDNVIILTYGFGTGTGPG